MNSIKCMGLKITSCVIFGLVASMSIYAAELSWKDTAVSGDFFVTENWIDDSTGETATNPPASGDAIVLGAGDYTATMNSSFAAGMMTLGDGAVLDFLATELNWSPDVAGWTNAGTIKFSSGGAQTWKLWSPAKQWHIIYVPGVIEVDGSTVTLTCRNRNYDNLGTGTWNVKNGGWIWNASFSLYGGGTFNVDSNSMIRSSGKNLTQNLTLDTFNNDGNLSFTLLENSGADGLTQYVGFYIIGNTVFNNSGEIAVTNNSTGVRKADARFRFDDDSLLINRGTFNLINIGTTNEFHRGYIMSRSSITNSGSILVSKGPTAGDTFLQVINSGSTYVQTNGSIRLEGGAEIRLPTDEIATIDGGTIGGDGYIDEKLKVAADAGLAFTLRGASDYDILTVEKTVQLDSGSEVQVSLADGFVPEDTDTFDVLVATGGFVSTDAETLVPVGTLPAERTWKVEIIGETAPQTLQLSVQTPPGGTVLIVR